MQNCKFLLKKLPVTDKNKELILGFKANLWTETVDSIERFDFLLFPRMTAMAESLWSNNAPKDYADFLNCLKSHLKQYKDAGLYYFNPFDIDEHPEATIKK